MNVACFPKSACVENWNRSTALSTRTSAKTLTLRKVLPATGARLTISPWGSCFYEATTADTCRILAEHKIKTYVIVDSCGMLSTRPMIQFIHQVIMTNSFHEN